MTIEPDRGSIVYRAEMYQHMFTDPGLRPGHFEAAAIPEHRMKTPVVDSTELALKAIRDSNLFQIVQRQSFPNVVLSPAPDRRKQNPTVRSKLSRLNV